MSNTRAALVAALLVLLFGVGGNAFADSTSAAPPPSGGSAAFDPLPPPPPGPCPWGVWDIPPVLSDDPAAPMWRRWSKAADLAYKAGSDADPALRWALERALAAGPPQPQRDKIAWALQAPNDPSSKK